MLDLIDAQNELSSTGYPVEKFAKCLRFDKTIQEPLKLIKQRPLHEAVRKALSIFLKNRSNKNNAFRNHELIELTGRNPLSIKMFASYLKNKDDPSFRVKQLYEMVKKQSNQTGNLDKVEKT